MAGDDYVVRNAEVYRTGVAKYVEINADRSVIAPYLDALCDRVPVGSRMLDLGCGPGWETETLHRRGYVAVGFDMSSAFLDAARREHRADGHVRGDMRRLPFATGSFAGAWASASMLHLASADLDVALAEVARVVKGGGGFVASVQVGDSERFVPRKSDPGQELFYAYREPEDWRGRVESAGFVVDEVVTEVYDGPQPHLNEGARGWTTAIARRA